jgi:acyl transferase domain-containing protein
MKKATVFMFSGQGSQYYQMGRELYEKHPRFRLWMDHCDGIAGPLIHTSLVDVLYRQGSKKDPFDRILYTNPALLCIEYSLTQLLLEMGLRPDYLLGYSLGEITASVVSGAVSLEEGIRLTVDFARLLECESPPAGMLAIIESADVMARHPELFRGCWLTGRNFKNNFVVSGLAEDVRRLQEAMQQRNIITQRLPVNYAFHTELMNPLEGKFKELARQIRLAPAGIPFVSAFRAGPIQDVDENHLWDLIRYPIDFEKTIAVMLQKQDYIFIDVGPSGTLATFVKYLLPSRSNCVHLEVMNQFGTDLRALEKLRAALHADVRPALQDR